MNLAVVIVVALVAATGPAAPDQVGGGDPVFTRVEPHLAAGARALQAEDPDLALERFRRAEASTDEQRAIVEYNAGQALLLQAMTTAEAAAASAPSPAAGEPPTPPTPPEIADTLASFERAAALGRDPRFVSEARLAAGNAALVGSKLDDAIAQFRKALVADPRNERARHNLQRALELKQQQPEQQPQDGDGEGNDDSKKDGDKKDGDQEQKDGAQQGQKDEAGDKDKAGGDDDKPADENKPDDKKESAGNEQKPADDKKPGEKDAPGDDDGGEGKDGTGEGKKPAPAPKKPTSKQEARRLLEGIRSRERPLSPIEMRGTERRPAENGKDW